MDGFLDRSPSDDEDPPFPITAPSELDDSEYDQRIELGSATNHLVNSSTNLNPDILLEQQSEPQSPSISFDTKLLCSWLQRRLELWRQRQFKLQFQHELQLELRLKRQLKLALRPQRRLQLQLQLKFRRQRNRLLVDERYNQELYCLFNMFHDHKINAEKLDTALKSLKDKYYYLGTDHHRFIHCGDVPGTSLSRLEGAGSSGYPIGIELVDKNADPSSSVKHSPPGKGKGKVPHEEGARGFADVSGDAIGSMNASREGDLEMGLVNSNADLSALGDVRSSVVHHVDHTGSGVSRANLAMTSFQVATAAYGTATSKFAQASHTTSLTTSMAAFLLADTKWKAATPILTKAGSVVCGVGVLAGIGKDLPLALFLVAISTALLIIIVAILCAKRPM